MQKVRLPKGRRKRVLRRRALYSESAYREVARCGPMVELEVLDVPGLTPGTHVRVTSDAVQAMTPDMSRARQRVARVTRFARDHGSKIKFLRHVGPKLKLPTA